uniref:Histonelysine Nmethyltransferase SETMARlike [Ceratitis capitata] n=1 Tax=Lepeophtheirus salmonis TaxID=72036 RepID=A0A0K2T435_LEPSM
MYTITILFWFVFQHSGSSDLVEVNPAPHTGRPIVENVDKIMEKISRIDSHFSSRRIAHEMKIDHKTF